VTLVTPPAPDVVRRLNGAVAVVFPRFSELAPRITIERALQDEAGYVKSAFAPLGVEPETLVVGIEPTADEIAAAAAIAGRVDAAILFLFDAHLYPSNRRSSTRSPPVGRLRGRAAAGPLRRYPAPPGRLGLTAFGFRRCQLDAVIARLLVGLAG